MALLSEQQIEVFLRDGVLVVDGILDDVELDQAKRGLTQTLAENGVSEDDLERTGHALQNLSSTNGSGGVLDIFYPQWKLDVATNPKIFQATRELWKAAYYHENESIENLDKADRLKWHPYGSFNTDQGFMYMDRIGYRIPTCISEKIGAGLMTAKNGNQKRKKKIMPLQRSLTPHLDCCPTNLYSDKSKWRPIQSFVSLTTNAIKNTGGFEAAPGFHKDFENWVEFRPPTIVSRKVEGISQQMVFSAPCIGEYSHIRPIEDKDVMMRMQHIPVRAGSAVFWDNRIPHANEYRNDGLKARSVVYCSFLPNIVTNREYTRNQLINFQHGSIPTDQWINIEEANNKMAFPPKTTQSEDWVTPKLSALGCKLMAIDPW